MKNLIGALLSIIMTLFSGCSDSANDLPDTSNQTQAVPSGNSDSISEGVDSMSENTMCITANGTTFTAKLADNSSAEAFRELLKKVDITINMHDYGSFEKVGSLGTTLPRNDESITTEPGDVILYQGTSITVYYDKNTWDFTRLGKIENVTKAQLLESFGKGDVDITFSLK